MANLRYYCSNSLHNRLNAFYPMVEKTNYNPWPLGKLPKAWQRPEPDLIKEKGYHWDDPREIIDIFEKKVAKFAGSNYAVATDCCTHAIELCFRYLLHIGELKTIGINSYITIPRNTYVSAANLLIHLGFNVRFINEKWSGIYQFSGSRVIDGAVRWTNGMYQKHPAVDFLQCISFQIKKRIPIGKGGMILCNNKEEYDWLKLASYDGRDLSLPYDHPDHVKFPGFHYYMTPEDAARGIILMDAQPEVCEDTGNWSMYPDVQKMLKL